RLATLREMIDGAHAIIYSRDPEADRAFLDALLGLGSVDAGGGWRIFALPPSEIAVHPDDHGGRQELYLLTPDLDALLAELGIEVGRQEVELLPAAVVIGMDCN